MRVRRATGEGGVTAPPRPGHAGRGRGRGCGRGRLAWGAGLLALGALACTTLAVPVAAATRSTTTHRNASHRNTPHRAPYALGAYAGSGDPASVTTFGTLVGARMQYAMEFLDGTSWDTITHPQWQLSRWTGSGYAMVWAVPMLPDTGASLAKGATGAYDTYFKTLAETFVAAGQGDALIRIGWEFNGIWFPWGADGHASAFVAYWRHIVTAMRSVPGAGFKFVWNPDRGDFGAGNLAAYYPGNAYVDDVALDVYDEEWQHYGGAAAEVSTIVHGPYGLDWLAGFAATHHKAMAFPEWGLGWGTCSKDLGPVNGPKGVCGGDNPVFIRSTSRWFAAHDVALVSYWDYGSSRVTRTANPKTRVALATTWVHHGVPARAAPRHT